MQYQHISYNMLFNATLSTCFVKSVRQYIRWLTVLKPKKKAKRQRNLFVVLTEVGVKTPHGLDSNIFVSGFHLNVELHTCTVRAPVFGRYQFFGTSEHYGKTHGSLLTLWMNYNYIACCWFPTSSNILILPSQFWQIGFESYWLHCSKCRILVLLRYSVVDIWICSIFLTIWEEFHEISLKFYIKKSGL